MPVTQEEFAAMHGFRAPLAEDQESLAECRRIFIEELEKPEDRLIEAGWKFKISEFFWKRFE